MKEFDFDELDKAVNSLMGDVKKSDTNPATDSPVTVPEPPATTTSPEPTVVLPDTPEKPISSDSTTLITDKPPAPPSLPDTESAPTRPSTPILPPRRGGGRFMDVVHPSSDMSSPTPSASVSSRQGKPLAPVTMTDEVKTTSPVIDIMAPSTPPSTPEIQASPAEEETAPAEEAIPEQPTEPTTSSDPWSSPFLPDTQVEKRPLGGLPVVPETGLSEAITAELSKGSPSEEETTVNELKPDNADATVSDASKKEDPASELATAETPEASPDVQLGVEPTPAAVPDELNNDLVAIESGQKTATIDKEIQTPQPSSHSTDAISSMPVTLSVGSIPPQYEEQPSSGDASHTPIYDNEAAAHHPLTHPAKKKKSWVLVLFIVIILAVGGALGALAYFLGLV